MLKLLTVNWAGGLVGSTCRSFSTAWVSSASDGPPTFDSVNCFFFGLLLLPEPLLRGFWPWGPGAGITLALTVGVGDAEVLASAFETVSEPCAPCTTPATTYPANPRPTRMPATAPSWPRSKRGRRGIRKDYRAARGADESVHRRALERR